MLRRITFEATAKLSYCLENTSNSEAFMIHTCKLHVSNAVEKGYQVFRIEEIFEGDDYIVCDFCDHVCYVSVYECNQAYGGGEEGGWWYSTGEPQIDIRNKTFPNKFLALQYREELAAILEADDNIIGTYADGTPRKRRHESSVACDGYFRAIIDVDSFPAYYPKSRPHYE